MARNWYTDVSEFERSLLSMLNGVRNINHITSSKYANVNKLYIMLLKDNHQINENNIQP